MTELGTYFPRAGLARMKRKRPLEDPGPQRRLGRKQEEVDEGRR